MRVSDWMMAASLASCGFCGQQDVSTIGDRIMKLSRLNEQEFTRKIRSALIELVAERLRQLSSTFLGVQEPNALLQRDVEEVYRKTCRQMTNLEWIMPRDLPGVTVSEMQTIVRNWSSFLIQWPMMHEIALEW
jgi:hypothetical protein